MRGWLDFVLCPSCSGTLVERGASALLCQDCGLAYRVADDIPVLMPDETQDTKLDVETYARLAAVGPNALVATHRLYLHAVQSVGKTLTGNMLEIGTGTGLLTEAMLQYGNFDRIVSTDVSVGFIGHTKARLGEPSPRLSFVACDGNTLPFREGSFDVVFGRSVLHHLLHYKTTLDRARRLLRPGGVAVFFEPVQSGKALISYMYRIILGIDAQTGAIGLSRKETGLLQRSIKKFLFKRLNIDPDASVLGLKPEEKKIMLLAIRAMMRTVTVAQTEESLAQLEDKYVFDVNKLSQEAMGIGYKSVRFVNPPNFDRTYFNYLSGHLRSIGVREEIITKLSWMKSAFGDTIGAMEGGNLSAPMGCFIFETDPSTQKPPVRKPARATIPAF